MIYPRSQSYGRVIPAASFRIVVGKADGAAGFNLQQAAGVGPSESHKLCIKRGATPRLCNQFHRPDVLPTVLPVDFALEPLLRLEVGDKSGAQISMNEFCLDDPRWPKGPAICVVENLPAFESEAALNKFQAANGPSCNVVRKWLCDHCEGWHAEMGKKAK